MGKTQKQLLEETTSPEITEAMAFEELEPQDPWLMVAMICFVIANFTPGVKKKFKLTDFHLPSQQGETGRSIFNKLKARVQTAQAQAQAKAGG